MSFTAQDVKALRQMTNAPMMECKNALVEANGDVDAAKKVLRERGLAKMAKRADRATAEGLIRVNIGDGNRDSTAVVVTCETDFTANNDHFKALADAAIAAAASVDGDEITTDQVLAAEHDGKSITAHLEEVANAIRENMGVSTAVRYAGVSGGYVHFNGKLGVIGEATVSDDSKAGSDEVAQMLKDVAMHVAAADPAPLAVSRDGIDPKVVEEEKEILVKQAVDSGKPEDIAQKMVEGRMKKFYSERSLLEQPFVINPEQTVGEYLAEAGKGLGTEVTVSRFERMQIGG